PAQTNTAWRMSTAPPTSSETLAASIHPGSVSTGRVSRSPVELFPELATYAVEHVEHPPRGDVQALLKQCQRVMRIGQLIRLAGEIIGRLRKARQHIFEEHLEALRGHCLARRRLPDP